MGLKYGARETWAVIDKRYKWMAIDSVGVVWAFLDEPKMTGDPYYSEGAARLDMLTFTDLPADWRDSLIERPHEWRTPDETTPVDTPVWVRDSGYRMWVQRYFHTATNVGWRCYRRGQTGWGSKGKRSVIWWAYCVLADPGDPDREPPTDDPELGKMA